MALAVSTERPGDPERALVLSYSPPAARGGIAALFMLDDALARLLRTTREPAIGQIRLAWWRERLAALERGGAPAEPVLAALAETVVSAGVRGETLVPIVDGWEVLIEDRLDEAALAHFGEARGETLFQVAAQLCGGTTVAGAGAGWALADLSRHLSDEATASAAARLAAPALDRALSVAWPAPVRALGALAHLARMDLALPPDRPRPTGAPRRVGRVLWHRLTGR